MAKTRLALLKNGVLSKRTLAFSLSHRPFPLSPTVRAGYLMETMGLSANDAISLVKFPLVR